MSAPDLSLVIPVYNEAQILPSTLSQVVSFLEELASERAPYTFEVVFVDDGSSDTTHSLLEEAAASDDRLRVLQHEVNRGKGAAVRTGVRAARGEVVLFLDADLSTPLSEMRGFLGAIDSGYQVVLGNRRAPGSKITRHQPFLREFLGKGFTTLTRMLLAPGINDFTCGFKAFRRDAAEAIFARSTLDGWAFDAELVVIAQEQDLRMVQVPVAWHDEDDTKVRVLGAVFGSLRELAVIWVRRVRGRYR